MPTFPLGHHAHLQRLNNAQQIALLELEPTPTPTHHYAGYIHPDPQDLRGIPCLARSVGGTIPGTQPEHHACR